MNCLILARAMIIVSAVTLVILVNKPAIPSAPKPTLAIVTSGGMKLSPDTDPTHIFRKAFGRHPTDDDKILHADRREWSDEEGVRKWQWFLAVSPGRGLLEWLGTNPSSITVSESGCDVENPPEWFPELTDDYHIMKGTEGRFIILLSTDRKLIYATDSGFGFTEPRFVPLVKE